MAVIRDFRVCGFGRNASYMIIQESSTSAKEKDECIDPESFKVNIISS